MFASLAMLTVAALTTPTVTLDGTRLSAGSTCYDITARGKSVGKTWQRIQAAEKDGRATWDIVVHQRFADGSFDMRDHFVVDRKTMQPLSLESDRGRDRTAKGWQRIRIAYGDHHASGTRQTAEGTSPIDTNFDHAVWDGNLWGLTFVALPLKEGATFTVPIWQYDKGLGQLTVKVTGKEVVHTPKGDVSAWTVMAGDSPDKLVHYRIAMNAPAELGYEAGPFAQAPGGQCVDPS